MGDLQCRGKTIFVFYVFPAISIPCPLVLMDVQAAAPGAFGHQRDFYPHEKTSAFFAPEQPFAAPFRFYNGA
jgi:hypothetical protein